jgi:hypothetical protein
MNKNVTQNSREFTRIPINLTVEVQSGDTVVKTDKTLDLSMKGIGIQADQTLPKSTECTVRIFLGGDESGISINVKGKVMRSVDSQMAIEFTKIDLDSYEYLQNLVMHNSNSSHEAVEEEIHNHLGLKRRD